jgi:DNA-binding transcriptional regulator YiaG
MKIKDFRKEFGISQIGLAQMVGVSLLTIQLWERGVGTPNNQNKEKLMKVMEKIRKERQE